MLTRSPCSVHDPEQALTYAKELQKYAETAKEDLMIVMRVYFEKPRTTVGWKGLINDPDMNNTYQINRGLRMARKLLIEFTEMGLPTAGEYLGEYQERSGRTRVLRSASWILFPVLRLSPRFGWP
jgi:phospho-2-dehydro-3-deoxyheptonate aldolase